MTDVERNVADINVGDTISRQAAIDGVKTLHDVAWKNWHEPTLSANVVLDMIRELPSAQPFHNTTMNEVLEYIDDMPEDVWQEFTACLECRGWELQRRTAKWCGGDFA